MRPRLLISAVVLGSTFALTACGGSSSSVPPGGETVAGPVPSNAPKLTPREPQTSALNTSNTAPAPTGVAAPSAPVSVNKTIVDPALGNKATVLKYVLGYSPSQAALQKYGALSDEKIVLVEVRVTTGKKYYGTFGPDDFRLTGNSNGIDTTTTTILDDELTKAGYPPLKDADTGKTATGWLIFTPQDGLSKYVLRYKRLAYRTSDGKSIKPKTFDLPLN